MDFIDSRGTWGKKWYCQYRSDRTVCDAPGCWLTACNKVEDTVFGNSDFSTTRGRAPVGCDHLTRMGVRPDPDPLYSRGVVLDFSYRQSCILCSLLDVFLIIINLEIVIAG